MPHGGAGIGIERLVNRMLNLSTVMKAGAVPRDRYRLSPQEGAGDGTLLQARRAYHLQQPKATPGLLNLSLPG